LICAVGKSAIRLKVFGPPCLGEKLWGSACEICINPTLKSAFPSPRRYISDSNEGMSAHSLGHFLWHVSGWSAWNGETS
jgi:hypothetical protein